MLPATKIPLAFPLTGGSSGVVGYAAGLLAQFNLPVFPILITSYERPATPEPGTFQMSVGSTPVLQFHYRVIQLNRLKWRDFARLENPATIALMARMNIAPGDRARVKLQILRLLVRLRLDRERQDLIAGFADHYLALTAKEILEFERELDHLPSMQERVTVMNLMTSWERKGLEQGLERGLEQGREQGLALGRAEGRRELVMGLLTRRCGPLTASAARQLRRLDSAALDELAAALLDFSNPADLKRWLAARAH